jgi:hypothetical protein
MKTMASEIVGSTILAVHTAAPPSKDEWDHFLVGSRTLLDRAGPARARCLVVTEGGGPSFSQRQQLNEVLQQRSPPGAIVSSNAFVRAIVIALSVFNRNLKVFSPRDMTAAFQYLELSPLEQKTMSRTIVKLQGELGIKAMPDV